MIMICYDGSADARAAIERAGVLFAGASAVVLTVWEPFVHLAARSSFGFGMTPTAPNADDVDKDSEERAANIAEEGVALARQAGLKAEPRLCSQLTTTGRTILGEADALDADAIVMGSRGLTGLKSLLLGSVSHEVIQQANRTVVVVPSAGVAASRTREVLDAAES